MVHKLFLLFLLLQCVFPDQSDLEIRTLLMDEKLRKYNRKIPPTTIDNLPVKVEIGFGISRLVDINEGDQSLTLDGWINAFWRDHRLAWNLSEFHVNTMYYSQDDIWIPDLWIENSLKDNQFLGHDDLYCFVYQLGDVIWSPGGLFKTRCELDVTYFPFDSQICKIVVSTWVLQKPVVNITVLYETIEGYLPNLVIADSSNSLWDITDKMTFAENASHLPAGAVGLQISLRRCSVFYVINLIFPLICISSLLCLVFALPIDQGDRISLAMSILLTFVVFLTLLNEYLPQTSRQTSILTIYLTTLFLIGTISVVLAVFTLRLSSLEDTKEIPAWLKRRIVHKKHTSHDKRVSCVENRVTSLQNQEKTEDEAEQDKHLVEVVKWNDVSRYIDRILMYAFLIIIIITNTLYFVVTFTGTGLPHKC